ncbi:MAG: hypothetical protein UHS41_01505 [Lachnospiraceae bacterium]|nr:hypothetical protein [Lachnospiraceae bacterium]
MLKGKIVRDTETIGSRFYAEIEGERLFDADVPSALTVQKFYFTKDGKQVYLISYNPSEGIKNAARSGKERKNDLYDIINFRNKTIGSICERTDHALISPCNYGEIKYGPTMYEGYVVSVEDGIKVVVIEQETGRQVALGEKTEEGYDLYGISEIALKVISIFIVIGEVKTKHNYGMISFEPKRLTKNRKLLSKYHPDFKKQ